MSYSKGDVVVIDFPFSNLLESKKRPAFVLADTQQDVLCCAITSQPDSEGVAIEESFLPFKSRIKFWKLQSIKKELVVRTIGKANPKTHKEVVSKIIDLIKA